MNALRLVGCDIQSAGMKAVIAIATGWRSIAVNPPPQKRAQTEAACVDVGVSRFGEKWAQLGAN